MLIKASLSVDTFVPSCPSDRTNVSSLDSEYLILTESGIVVATLVSYHLVIYFSLAVHVTYIHSDMNIQLIVQKSRRQRAGDAFGHHA